VAAPTHYDTLGVASDSDPLAIREAYLRRARTLHPDTNSGRSSSETERSESDLRVVNEAWQVLKDPMRRRRYDEDLESSRPTSPVSEPRQAPFDDYDPEVESEDDGIVVSPAAAMLLRLGPALLLGVVLFGLLIITAVAGGGRKDDGDRVSPQRCVLVDTEGAVRSSCADGNGFIVAEVNSADQCPALSVAFGSDRAGVLWCVEIES
jgi:curved DNA-binding protein CbpA